jgi:hypothetical protein
MVVAALALLLSPLRPIHPRPTSRTRSIACCNDEKVVVNVDLGAEGEPKGECRLLFRPLLSRSEFLLFDLRVPLGLLIEETDSNGILVTGALPGFSAIGHAQAGDLLRAVTAYRPVIAGAPMWQQVISYTPVGTVQLKRMIFRTEGATYLDVRDAIASHRSAEGGNDVTSHLHTSPDSQSQGGTCSESLRRLLADGHVTY